MSVVICSLQRCYKIAVLIFIFYSISVFSQKKKSIVKNLSNGLGVYVQQNLYSEKETLFYFLVKAGSIHETKNELGYAHILEHLAFKKGERFSNQSITDFFKSQGLQVGKHYNAITNYEYTLYQVKLPGKPSDYLQRKVFLFFADILNGLSFTKQDLETEQKIVLAEKQSRALPDAIFNFKIGNSLYKKRLPIGTKKSIQSATIKKIRSFYKKWYQPKNCAVFVVGKVNPESTVKIIDQVFGNCNNTSNINYKTVSIYNNLQDAVQIDTAQKAEPNKLHLLLAQKQLKNNKFKNIQPIFNSVLKYRVLKALSEKKENAYMFYDDEFLSDVNYFTFSAGFKTGVNQVLKCILIELQRIQTFGISNQELQFHKDNFVNREPSTNFTNNFIIDQAIISFVKKQHFNFKEKINIAAVKLLTPDDFKDYANYFFRNIKKRIYIKTSNLSITKDRIHDLQSKISKLKIEPYVFVPQKKPRLKECKSYSLKVGDLISKKPQITYFKKLGVTKLDYNNGASIILKPITDKSNQISVIGVAKGGYASISDKDFYKYESSDSYVNLGGVGNLNTNELNDYLSDKIFGLTTVISDFERLVHANTTNKDKVEFFKYLYAKLTQSNTDKKEFTQVIKEEVLSLKAKKNKSIKKLDITKEVEAMLGNYFPARRIAKTPQDYKELNLFEMQGFYNKAFKYANGWNYIIVGDFSLKAIIPILNTYLGNLPKANQVIENVDFNYQKILNYQEVKSDTLTSMYVSVSYVPFNPKSLKNKLMLLLLKNYLQLKVTNLLREQNGFVYSPRVTLDKKYTQNPLALLKIEYTVSKKYFFEAKQMLQYYLKDTQPDNFSEAYFNQLKKQVELSFKSTFQGGDYYQWSSELIDNIGCINDLENIEQIVKSITKKEFINFVTKFKNKPIKIIEIN